jgi:hypothetical protein
MRVCLAFYRTLAVPLIAITLICGLQVCQAHSVYFILRVLWEKILTSIVIGTYIGIFRSEQFLFYNNLGYSRTHLFAFTFAFDFLIWMSVMAAAAGML